MKRDLLSVKTQQVPFVCGLGMKSQSGVWGYAPALQAGERAPLGLRDSGDWSHAPAVRDSAWRKSEIARSACATMRVSREISIYRAQRSQQGCSLSLGMLRLAEPPTGRARLRSSLKSPRNPITPIQTSRIATLHLGLYKGLREGVRRVIGATAKPLYAIGGKAGSLDRRF